MGRVLDRANIFEPFTVEDVEYMFSFALAEEAGTVDTLLFFDDIADSFGIASGFVDDFKAIGALFDFINKVAG